MKRDVVEIGKAARPVRERVSAEEWQLRCELAAAHRLVAHFVFVDMTYNHISARLPGEPEHFLVKADNVFMEQVTASNLVKYDVDGRQGMAFRYNARAAPCRLSAAALPFEPAGTPRCPAPSPFTKVAATASSVETLSGLQSNG